jgi:hypothetical protein
MSTNQHLNRKFLVRLPGRKQLPEIDYQVGDKVWINGAAHLYRDFILCFSGEASARRGKKMFKQLQASKSLLILPPVRYPGFIKGSNTLPGSKDAKGKSTAAFTAYHIEVAMDGQTFEFITTAEWLEARELINS